MTLMEELKERWKAIFLERESVEKRADELAENMQELEVALAALQSLHNPIADEQPELFDEPQEIEASSQSESCVPALGAETDLQASPGEAEESRDHSDDVSEFGDPDEPAEHISILTGDPAIEPESGLHGEGYAPVTNPEPSTLIDAQTCEPVNPHVEPETLADPIWNEPAPTRPEADALAKANDWYDPKAIAERNRFDPFRMFKREDA